MELQNFGPTLQEKIQNPSFVNPKSFFSHNHGNVGLKFTLWMARRSFQINSSVSLFSVFFARSYYEEFGEKWACPMWSGWRNRIKSTKNLEKIGETNEFFRVEKESREGVRTRAKNLFLALESKISCLILLSGNFRFQKKSAIDWQEKPVLKLRKNCN